MSATRQPSNDELRKIAAWYLQEYGTLIHWLNTADHNVPGEQHPLGRWDWAEVRRRAAAAEQRFAEAVGLSGAEHALLWAKAQAIADATAGT